MSGNKSALILLGAQLCSPDLFQKNSRGINEGLRWSDYTGQQTLKVLRSSRRQRRTMKIRDFCWWKWCYFSLPGGLWIWITLVFLYAVSLNTVAGGTVLWFRWDMRLLVREKQNTAPEYQSVRILFYLDCSLAVLRGKHEDDGPGFHVCFNLPDRGWDLMDGCMFALTHAGFVVSEHDGWAHLESRRCKCGHRWKGTL